MSAVRSKDTAYEIEIRKSLFANGFRYRLHGKNLPGKPDMVFPKYNAVILVNGCFWHNHDCRFAKLPETRRAWWKQKLYGNRIRDKRVMKELKKLGWRTLIIWECSFRKPRAIRGAALDKITKKAIKFLLSRKRHLEISEINRRKKLAQ